nr:ribonuclease H-like domain-containing protein [Tanacetum cinerariifolium]
MVPNVDEASTSHNVFNERLEDAYFDESTSFHDPSNVYPHEKKWTNDHPLHKLIGDPKSSVRTRCQLAISCLLSTIEPANVAEALRDVDWFSEISRNLRQRMWKLLTSKFLRMKKKFFMRVSNHFKRISITGVAIILLARKLGATATVTLFESKKETEFGGLSLLVLLLARDYLGVPVQDPTLYRSLAGGLQYLTFTRPDISYVVQQICLYMHDLREPHLAALKRILRYIRGTINFRFHLYASTTISLVGYTDADWAGCLQQGGLLQFNINGPIEIDIHFVRDLVTAGQVRVLHVPYRYQYADIFTKGLPSALFEDFRSSLSVRLPPARTAGAY